MSQAALVAVKAAAALRQGGYPGDADHARALLADMPGARPGEGGIEFAGYRLRLIDPDRLEIVSPEGAASLHTVGPVRSPHQAEAEQCLEAILGERPLCVAASFGKDSSVVVALALNAAVTLKRKGLSPRPLIITSADTGVENPEVVAIREAMISTIKAHAEAVGIEVHIEVTRPRLAERFWPRILAGRKLPSFPGSNGDCTVDMKIKPQQRARKAIDTQLASRGYAPAITAVGTRYDESARRASNMAERGEGDTIVDGVIAPIADWTTVQVFEFLADPTAPKPPLPFDQVLDFYTEAGGGECGFTPEAKVGKYQACGARAGCFTCLMVSEDRSVEALIEAGHDHLAPLLAINRYLRAIRHDYSRRKWIGKQIDPITHHARIQPQCFSFETTDVLMRVLLTVDAQERERAAALAADLAAGVVEDSPRNRRLAAPQFCNLSFDDILAIDFWRSVDGLGPEHAALRAWQDVVVDGQRYPVPEIDPVPAQPLPPPRFLPVPVLDPLDGLLDPIESLVGAGARLHDDPLTGEQSMAHPSEADQRYFDIDLESASLFEEFELADALAQSPTMAATQAARRYLRLGLAPIPSGGLSSLDRQLSRTLGLARAGLLNVSPAVANGALTEREHDQLRRSLATNAGLEVAGDQAPVARAELEARWAAHHARRPSRRWTPPLCSRVWWAWSWPSMPGSNTSTVPACRICCSAANAFCGARASRRLQLATLFGAWRWLCRTAPR